MNVNKSLLRPGSLLLAAFVVVLFPTSAMAGEKCDFDFALEQMTAEWLSVSLDNNSSKFQEYRDLEEGFRVPDLKLVGTTSDGQRWIDFRVKNGGRNDARYTLGYGVDGRYQIELDHNLIPHNFGNDATFLWTETRPGVFEIANSVQTALQQTLTARRAAGGAINFAYLNGLVAPLLAVADEIDVGLQRDRSRLKVDIGGLGEARWGLEYRHEKRTGNRAYGAGFGFGNVTEMPEPIHYTTSDLELSADWSGENYGIITGVRHSVFKNDLLAMYWDNPFRITDSTDANAYQAPTTSTVNGAARGFAALAPDNKASSIFASGHGKAGAWWMNGNLTFTQMRQNDELLPYTLNSAIVGLTESGARFNPTLASNLPQATADRKVDVTVVNAAAGRDFGKDWSLTLRYAYYDYENNSPRVEFPGYVRFQGVWEDIGRITVPYAYSKQDFGGELAWDINQANRLAFSYKLRSWDREYRETEGTDEDIMKVSFDSKPTRMLTFRASWERADRSIDGEYLTEAQEYSFTHPEGINNLPGLRKFAQAAREYDDYTAQLQFFPIDTLQLSVGVSSRDEEYDESEFGLATDEVLQWNAEIDYAPGANLNFFAFVHQAERESFQNARQSAATPSTDPRADWDLLLDEKTDTYGFGLEAKPVDKIKLTFSGNWSKSDGEADFQTPANSTLPVTKDIDNYEDIELFTGKAGIEWQVKENFMLGFGYLYEDFTLDRFILQGLKSYLPAALLLAANEGTYQADVYMVQVGFNF